MDETREDRMRSRMRGAARHQVNDVDFGDLFTIPALVPEPAHDLDPEPSSSASSDPPTSANKPPTPAPPPPPPPPPPAAAKRTSPNTSAKRRRLDPEPAANTTVASQAPSSARPISANRASRRLPPPASSDPYDLENAPGSPTNPPRSKPRTVKPSRPPSRELGSPGPPEPAVQNAAPPLSSPPVTTLPADEVSESPANEPGSGHRTRARNAEARGSSAILQSALRTADSDPAYEYMQSSSPLSRLSRKSIAGNLASAKSTRTGLRRSTRLSGSPDEEVDEIPSDPSAEPVDDTIAEEPAPAPATGVAEEENLPEVAETVIEEPAAAGSPEVDEAREVDDREAALRLGRKRPRRSIPAPSPELASQDASEEPEPVVKRPRKEVSQLKKQKSPAKQRQPKAPRARKTRLGSKSKSRRKSKGDGDNEGDPGRSVVGIAVQRFTKIQSQEDDSDDEDVLNTMKLHSDRGRFNAIDVLAQICKEVIRKTLKTFKDALGEAQDAPTKRELQAKVSALGAFQEEVHTRLLEHAIAIDNLYSLKQRVREAQKEKVELRERLMEIRTEREHVALRMNAVRAKHEEESKEALHNISLSAAMHDVDLAIEQGRAAPALSAKDAKTADLANLELLIGKVAEQACGGGGGGGGGTLGQIKGFNAFLERAMAVL